MLIVLPSYYLSRHLNYSLENKEGIKCLSSVKISIDSWRYSEPVMDANYKMTRTSNY